MADDAKAKARKAASRAQADFEPPTGLTFGLPPTSY